METLAECTLCRSSRIETACAQNAFCRCLDCGLYFDNPRPTWGQILEFYSQNDKYDEWLAEENGRDALWRRRLRLVRRHCSKGRLLDVGAGIGQFLHFAREYFEVAGTEISPVACRIAREKYGVDLYQGTLESLPGGATFDVVTLFHVLEHVPDPRDTLKKCFSLLNPRGVLVVAVPNDVDSILTRRNRMMERLGAEKYRVCGKLGLPRLALDGSEIHLSHFTAPVLQRALSNAGLEVVESSLDPFFSVSGMRKVRRYRRYYWYKGVHALFGSNLYDTTWMVAQRPN